jgi:hypothetical protein
MEAEPSKAAPPNRKRRWFQFSLRSLLIFTVLCAIGSAWLGKRIERKRKEREAVEAIVKLQGQVSYDYQRIDASNWRSGGEPFGPAWLRTLLGENFFSEVELVYAFGDGLEHLKELPNLPELRLMGRGVTDAGLVNLKGLTKLKNVGFIDTKVTEPAVIDLQKALPNCYIMVIHQFPNASRKDYPPITHGRGE